MKMRLGSKLTVLGLLLVKRSGFRGYMVEDYQTPQPMVGLSKLSHFLGRKRFCCWLNLVRGSMAVYMDNLIIFGRFFQVLNSGRKDFPLQAELLSSLPAVISQYTQEMALANQSLNLTGKILGFYVKITAGSKGWRPAG